MGRKYNIFAELRLRRTASTPITNLLILLFGPRTFDQFWIQDLVPAVLTLMLGVSLHNETLTNEWIWTLKKSKRWRKRQADSLGCSWRYISSQQCPVSGPAPSASHPTNTHTQTEERLPLLRSAVQENHHFRWQRGTPWGGPMCGHSPPPGSISPSACPRLSAPPHRSRCLGARPPLHPPCSGERPTAGTWAHEDGHRQQPTTGPRIRTRPHYVSQENPSGGFGFSGNSTGLHGDLKGFNGP